MDPFIYSLGILFGLIAGIIFGTGTVMQKYAINSLPEDSELMKSLIKNRLWVTGFLFQFFLGSLFLIIAQLFIGPALVPGLTAVGLIVLAIGSVKIIGESLKPSEIFGIALMIFAIFLLSFSGLSIELIEFNYLEFNFLFRFAHTPYLIGFSALPLIRASSDTPFTLMTFQRTPGRSPTARPLAPPIPSTMTRSCSSIKLSAPSPGRKAVIAFPFFFNSIRRHFLIAEFGCLLSLPTFAKTIPNA